MNIISIINQKGGTGKTTITANLAFLLSKIYKRKILFIDLDKQGNGSSLFGVQEDRTITDLFVGGKDIEEVIQHSKYGVDVITSNMDLLKTNFDLVQNKNKQNVHLILKNALQRIKGKYDIVMIDNPPDINIPVLNGLIITKDVIMVATPDGFSKKGLIEMKNQIAQLKKINPAINYKGCVLNKFIKTAHTITYLNELKKVSPVFNETLRYTRDRVDLANDEGKMIYEISPNCGFAQDLKKLAQKLMKEM